MVGAVSSFIPALQPTTTIEHHRYIHVIGSSVFVSDRVEIDDAEHHFLGMYQRDDGAEAVWAVDVPHGEDPSYGAATDLFTYFGRSSEEEWAIAGRAVQLAEWARTHKFCGRCGTPTVRSDNDRSMKCPACNLLAYPRLAPAMITLVTRGEGADSEALLARGVAFRAPMYSCLAGFVEPGESLEQSVIREVREEVGIEIDTPTYVSSQPWPFPHSLMLGFRANWLSGDIVCDPTEIMDAQWYRRDELPNIPPRISIARKLIDMWVAEG
jgi:NAD+ diphosphatase